MSDKACGPIVIGVIVAIIVGIIALIATSLEKLNSDEVGIKYNVVTKSLSGDPSYEGLHNGPPGFTFIIFPSVFRTLSYGHVMLSLPSPLKPGVNSGMKMQLEQHQQAMLQLHLSDQQIYCLLRCTYIRGLKCLNKDGVQISLDISYQYRIRGNEVSRIVREFKDHDTFQGILSNLGKSAMLDSCSKFNTSQFQSDRGAFQEHLRTRLVNKYSQVFVDVTDLQVNDIVRPSRYESAVRQKETAREDITVAENERPRRLTEAETQLLQAETTAAIAIDRASSNARITENQATAEAAGILNSYEKEAASYKYLTDAGGLNLDSTAFLAYMGVRAVEEAKNPVQLAMQGPAKTAYLNN